MFRTIKCCFSIFFWTSLAFDFPEQGFSRNRSDDGFSSCIEVIKLSKMVGWKTVIGYALEHDTNQNMSLCEESKDDSNCCQIKTILASSMNEQFNQSFSEKVYSISTVFSLSYKLFNFSFLNLLNHTKFELHFYPLSSSGQQLDEYNFFSDLFWDMEEYFTGHSSVNLVDTFLAFFDSLIKQLISFHYNDFNLEEATFECVFRLSKDIKPFGEVPTTLGNQMKKSFHLVRIFAQSLRQGQDILNLLEKAITPLLPCEIPMQELSYCSYCSDFHHFGRCSNTSCTSLVLNYCLKGLKLFEIEWLQYVDSLLSFLECFDQYCNVENVARSIEQNIIEAIETFQKTAKQFFNEVENKCGLLPPNYKEKRSPREMKAPPPPQHPSHVLMEKLKNIRVDVESRRDFLESFVTDACRDFLLPSHQGSYHDFVNCSSVVDILEQKSNLSGTTSYRELQFVQLSQKMKDISEKMKNALISYRAFSKIDATSSGFVIYSSGSGHDDDDDDEDDGGDDDDGGGDENYDNETRAEEQEEEEEHRPRLRVEPYDDDIAFEVTPSSCGPDHCNHLCFIFFIALFFV